MAGERNWDDLWKVYETIRKAVGGTNALVNQLQWITEDDKEAFRESANNPHVSGDDARHAIATSPTPPTRTMTIDEGRGFLGRTAKLFDEGHEDEGVRLAAVMRVLFHDTFHRKTGKPNSISLLTHLGMREGCTMLTTPPTQLADWRDFLAVKIDLNSATPSSLLPRLDRQLIEIPFRLGGIQIRLEPRHRSHVGGS